MSTCTRCGGNKIFFTHVHNGHRIPAIPDGGICYRCNGSGIEPETNSNQNIEEETNMLTNQQKQILVFDIMTSLISKKGDIKKMVSVYDILDVCIASGHTSIIKSTIENILNTYIKLKYVRYYKNEKSYIYFGITELGYARWGLYKVQQTLSQVAVDTTEDVAVNDNPISDVITITQQDVQAPPKSKRGRKPKTQAIA